MKANLFIHHFKEAETPLILAKLQQWTEFLQAAGIDATFLIQTDDPPAADLWQAAQGQDETPTVIEVADEQ